MMTVNEVSKLAGVRTIDFSVFDTKKIDEYAERAKEQWGKTPEFEEFQHKSQNWTKKEEQTIMEKFMKLFEEFGSIREAGAESEAAGAQVKKLQNYITDYFYECSDEILLSLGQMYAGCLEFTQNIDSVGGEGTAEFAAEAIRIYCEEQRQ